RIVYRAHVVTGELRAEENGSSDSACWVPIAELDTLRYGTLIDEVASMMGFQNAAAWSREYQEFLADENARKI
ncbi:MAG: phosphohydrolase, partial [Rothia mucilaginosa]|nr:phosphohydrolase [Rothia mucilaginosa]